MEAHKIQANEEFFTYLLKVVKNEGIWGWPDQQETFTISGGKILGSPRGLEKVKEIVSEKYFKNNFGILQENS
jgi:hypothetical protein